MSSYLNESLVGKILLNSPAVSEFRGITAFDDSIDLDIDKIDVKPLTPLQNQRVFSSFFAKSDPKFGLNSDQSRTTTSSNKIATETPSRLQNSAINSALIPSKNTVQTNSKQKVEKIIKKLDNGSAKPAAYLVQWSKQVGQSDENDEPSSTWEYADSLPESCRKAVDRFEKIINSDSNKKAELVVYQVERILQKRKEWKMPTYYYVKWFGFSNPTWELAVNLKDYEDLIHRFEVSQLNLRRKKKQLNPNQPTSSRLPSGIGTPPCKRRNSLLLKSPLTQPKESTKIKAQIKAEKILQKLDHGDAKPAAYLVQWPKASGQLDFAGNETQTWEYENILPEGCKELVAEFEQLIKTDLNARHEFLVYQIERILDRRRSPKYPVCYLVEWIGYADPTWELLETIMENYEDLILRFELSRPRVRENFKQSLAANRFNQETIKNLRRFKDGVRHFEVVCKKY